MTVGMSRVPHVRLKVDVGNDWLLECESMKSFRRMMAPINTPMRMMMTRSCPIVSPSGRFGVSGMAPH